MAEASTEKIRQRVDSSKFFNCRVTLLKIANLQQKHYDLRQPPYGCGQPDFSSHICTYMLPIWTH